MAKNFYRFVLPACFVLALYLAGCSGSRDASQQRGEAIQTGEASWYGPGFHGRQTANGERYNQNQLTAAHRTLEFGTMVRVVNLDNGKSVVVRINDRGPYARGRIIDLSRAAAREIDMIQSGVANVRLERLSGRQTADVNRESFTVQIGSYSSRSEARREAGKLSNTRVVQARVNNRNMYRVYYGSFDSRNEAERALRRLQSRGHNGFVKQEQN